MESAIESVVGERSGFGKSFRKMDDVRILYDEGVFGLEDPGWLRYLNDYLE